MASGKPNNIFPLLNLAGIGIKENFQIYGNDWPTKDGTCVRDYIHVMDIASGHICALKYLLENEAQVICLNLGTGKGTTVLELVKTYQKVNDVSFEIEFIDRRKGDAVEAVANNYLQKKNLIGSLKDQFKICAEMDLNGKRIYTRFKK